MVSPSEPREGQPCPHLGVGLLASPTEGGRLLLLGNTRLWSWAMAAPGNHAQFPEGVLTHPIAALVPTRPRPPGPWPHTPAHREALSTTGLESCLPPGEQGQAKGSQKLHPSMLSAAPGGGGGRGGGRGHSAPGNLPSSLNLSPAGKVPPGQGDSGLHSVRTLSVTLGASPPGPAATGVPALCPTGWPGAPRGWVSPAHNVVTVTQTPSPPTATLSDRAPWSAGLPALQATVAVPRLRALVKTTVSLGGLVPPLALTAGPAHSRPSRMFVNACVHGWVPWALHAFPEAVE